MDVSITYVPGEEREGYYVQSMVKRMWAVQIDMLKEIDAVCKRHDIKYYGWYGTLLGAVRHQGFIPWDDDIDLAMLRKDYERFRYYCKTELPKEWKISEKMYGFCILNTDVPRLDQKFLDKYHGCPLMTGIDIFCLDHIPRDKKEEESWLALLGAIYTLFQYWDSFEEDEEWAEGKWLQLKEIEKLTGHHFDYQYPIKEQLTFLAEKIEAVYEDESSDEVANAMWLYEHRHCRYPREEFNRVTEVPFEDIMLPILEDYDLICRVYYGDNYMVPVIDHAHNIYKEQMGILRDYFKNLGMDLPECFDIAFE